MSQNSELRQSTAQYDVPAGHFFPWLMEATAERSHLSENEPVQINPDYANRADSVTYAKVYGEIQTFEDLSDEARVCVRYLNFIYRNLIEQPFIESGGEDISVDPATIQLLKEYKQSLEERILNKHEHAYVLKQADIMQARFEGLAGLLMEAWLMGKSVPKNIPGYGTAEIE